MKTKIQNKSSKSSKSSKVEDQKLSKMDWRIDKWIPEQLRLEAV